MTATEAEKVEQLFANGHLIIIDDHIYLDSPVKKIYISEEKYKGDLCYDSEVMRERPLWKVPFSSVHAYKPISIE